MALTLPKETKLSLLVNLPHALAEKELRETDGAGLTIDGYYDLVFKATGSRKEAERRARARRSAILQAGETPV